MTTFDLRSLRLKPGDELTLEREVALQPLELGGQSYVPEPAALPVELSVAQTLSGKLLELRFATRIAGPCMRCLAPADVDVRVAAHEYDGGGAAARQGLEESTAYVVDEILDLSQWAHDEVALALPVQILCRPDCAGICPQCGKDLNVEPHTHEVAETDPRWQALAEIRDRLG